MEIDTSGTEKTAFSETGTMLGYSVNVPTREFTLTCIAPDGYKFTILEPIIVTDTNTNELSDLKLPDDQHPNLNKSENILYWNLKDPPLYHRMSVKYKLAR